MSTAQPLPDPPDLNITVTPGVTALAGGATLTLSGHVPLTAAERRTTALGALIYFYGGRIDTPGGWLGGYLGQSGDLNGPRAATSLTRWAVTQQRILPAGMALLRHPQPASFTPDFRRHVEARTIMTLSAVGLWLLNTHTSAGLASSRLTRPQVTAAEQLAAQLADTILTRLFGGAVNPHPSPACNTREAAVRVVLHAGRGLDTFEIMRALRANGTSSRGRSFDFTLRRDLRIRERETRGTPRVVSAWHRNRRIFWNPATLTKRQALSGYDVAHP